MNLKDYQRGRNDGLALALKIVQEDGQIRGKDGMPC